jgi:hypothetical protein
MVVRVELDNRSGTEVIGWVPLNTTPEGMQQSRRPEWRPGRSVAEQ